MHNHNLTPVHTSKMISVLVLLYSTLINADTHVCGDGDDDDVRLDLHICLFYCTRYSMTVVRCSTSGLEHTVVTYVMQHGHPPTSTHPRTTRP